MQTDFPGGGQWQDPSPKAEMIPVLDEGNLFMVAVQEGRLVILNPPHQPITGLQALNLAAWLVALASVTDPNAERNFARLLEQVKNS